MTLDEVHAYLVEKITGLLESRPDLLMSILYRIDVSESRVKEILSHAPRPHVPSLLADLVIDRQLQKVRIRRRYRESSETRRTPAK